MPELPVLQPEAQIAFALRVKEIQSLHLSVALAATIRSLSVPELDQEFAVLLSNEQLQTLAQAGLRAEVFFPSVALLTANPRLLGYYRLLYGFSQKGFYDQGPFGPFKSMEERGVLGARALDRLSDLCTSLCATGWLLLLNLPDLSIGGVRDLQMLTLGAQLRGSLINEIGRAGSEMVFRRIRAAIKDEAVIDASSREIVLSNASGRRVRVAFSSDPDIAITEDLGTSVRNILAVEVKAGTDVSNLNYRLGEANASHETARAKGFTECWTILNCPFDAEAARVKSPATTLFFDLRRILDPRDPEWATFRDQLAGRLGVPAAD